MPGPRAVTWLAAAAAMLLRFPGLLWPLGPDEAGQLLVARSWNPAPDTVYGDYWVDRPPSLIALVRLADAIGGAYFLRVVAALGCAVLVLLAAAVARRYGGPRAAAWTAVATAVLISSSLIDPVAATGEVLGAPLVVGSFLLVLQAVERGQQAGQQGTSAALHAFVAGVLAASALGLKQNLFGGLVFGGVVLIGSWWVGRIPARRFAALGGAALLGVAVPVLATIGWALASGVGLDTLAYAVVGFRSDASAVIAAQDQSAPLARALLLVVVAVASGMLLAVGWFLAHLREAWRRDPVLTTATVAVLVLEVLGVVLGGSYWLTYLINLVPATGLCVAAVAGLPGRAGRGARIVVSLAVVSSLVSAVGWLVVTRSGLSSPEEVRIGAAISRAARPGDTLVVYGGRADLQWASGLPSPYAHLWSLPMRTLDADLAELRALLAGPRAPTWLVAAAPFSSWDLPGHRELTRIVEREYDLVAEPCGRRVFVRAGVQRRLGEVECEEPWPGPDTPLPGDALA